VLVHGTADDQVPFWLSEQYVEAARAAGDDAELVTLEGDGHFEPIDPRSRSWPRVERAITGLLP
jgi:dipeptidyl aminopeptidase/acylaminoacyl peptidase